MWSLSDYPLDSDLFVRLSYPPFIQLGPMCIVIILWPVTLQDIALFLKYDCALSSCF